ncbi:MAG: hypothetical protein JXR64_01010 [Spirochaetales bacterium]|nr:hypothetical protein [Spirochaetales bacterium]
MLKKILTLTLLVFMSFNIYSRDKIVLLTKNVEVENIYKEITSINISYINFDIDFVEIDNLSPYLIDNWVEPPVFAIYIDENVTAQKIVSGFKRGQLPPLQIVKPLLQNLFIENRVAKYFLLEVIGLIDNKIEIAPIEDAKIPVLRLNMSIDPQIVIETLISPIPVNIEYITNYIVLNIFGETFYFTDGDTLIINGIFIFIIILVINIFRKRVSFHFKHNRRYIPSIPYKILALFLFNFIATLVIGFIESQDISGDLIYNFPRAILIIKILTAWFIYSICFQVIKDSALSKSPYFYAILSLYSEIFLYFLTLIYYQPLAIYHIWPITIIVIYILSSKKGTKRILLYFSPLLLIVLISKYFITGNLTLIDFFIKNRYIGNLILTFLSIPYIFLQESFFRFIYRKQNKISYVVEIVQSLLILTLIITISAIIIELNK